MTHKVSKIARVMFSRWKNKGYDVRQVDDDRGNKDETPDEGRITVLEEKQPAMEDNVNYDKITRQTEIVGRMEDSQGVQLRQNEDGEKVERRRGNIRSQTCDLLMEDVIKHPKTKSEEEIIKKAIRKNEFLKNLLKEHEVQAIMDAMSPREIEPRETIIRQNDSGDYMFVSVSGKYEILIDGQPRDTFDDSRIFGELAIIYSNPRFATVKALTKARVWILHRNVYKKIMRKNAMDDEDEMVLFLRNVPSVNKASEEKLRTITHLFRSDFYKGNTTIVKQGDKGDMFYIIKSGTVRVSVDGKGVVATLGRGEFFGERALLQEDCRQATVKSIEPGVECLVLSRIDFNNYLGDLDSFLQGKDRVARKASIENSWIHENVTLTDLRFVRTIGVGGFGRVDMAFYKTQVLAVKTLKKHMIVKNGQKDQAITEKQLQMQCNSNFIVGLFKTLQDRKYLYYIMECCMGGDLFGLMCKQRNNCFSEDRARFLSGCILEALAYLHERHIAYLDLKPENILVDAQGYVKLCDFGNAVSLLPNQKSFTFAGTPEYVAPEIIYERGHDNAADYWAFGVFVFELLAGYTPFRSNDPTYMHTFNMILKGIDDVSFPPKVTRNAENLIKKLCRPNKIRRLGCLKNGAEDVRRHKWYAAFDWGKLRRKELKSDFVPVLESSSDTKYFDRFRKDLDNPPEYEIWEEF